MTKTEKLERTLADLTAGRIKPKDAERLFFIATNGAQIRLSSPDAADKLRERIAKEKGDGRDEADA